MRKEYLVSVALVVGFVAILLGAIALLPDITSLITQVVAGVLIAIAVAAAVIFAKGFLRKMETRGDKESEQEETPKPNIVFEAEIMDKKPQYKLGDYVYFRTRYSGNLVNGFFDNEIYAPEGTPFPDGADHTWSWSMETLESTMENDATSGKFGKLNGRDDHEAKWHFIIERNYPKGIYRVDMRVYNQYDSGYRLSRTVIAHKEDTFEVV